MANHNGSGHFRARTGIDRIKLALAKGPFFTIASIAYLQD
jgi:hypothetical protein